VVVHRQSRVVDSDLRVVEPEDSFQDDQGFRLELDSLESIFRFEVNVRHLDDALCDVNLNRAAMLHGQVDRLRDHVEGALELIVGESLASVDEHSFGVDGGVAHVFHRGKHFLDVPRVEWQELVVG
jgi:hypothetical protein